MKALNTILETIAAKRAARAAVASPLAAAIIEAQTLHDSAVAEINAEIAALEADALKLAEASHAELFAKAKTYKHADSVLKLTTSNAVAIIEGKTEDEVVEALQNEAAKGDDAAEACLSRSVKLNKAHIKVHAAKHAEWFTAHGLELRTTQAVTIQAAA